MTKNVKNVTVRLLNTATATAQTQFLTGKVMNTKWVRKCMHHAPAILYSFYLNVGYVVECCPNFVPWYCFLIFCLNYHTSRGLLPHSILFGTSETKLIWLFYVHSISYFNRDPKENHIEITENAQSHLLNLAIWLIIQAKDCGYEIWQLCLWYEKINIFGTQQSEWINRG